MTNFIRLEVDIFHADGTPMEVRQELETMLRERYADCDVSVDMHSGHCLPDCPEPHDPITDDVAKNDRT